MQLTVDAMQAQGLLNYLAGRPWAEVQHFLALLVPQVERGLAADQKQAQERAGDAAGAANGGQVIPMGPVHG